MNLFLGRPSLNITDYNILRNKLVIWLTNGKYVVFDKNEIPNATALSMSSTSIGIWGRRNIDIEPFKTKILDACGSTSLAMIKNVWDRSGIIKGLGSGAFASCSNLESAVFPEVSFIREGSFLQCSKLVDVSLPKYEGFKGLNDTNLQTFIGCKSLKKLSFPSLVRFHQSYESYSGCSLLEEIYCPELTDISNNCSNLFAGTKLKKLYFPKLVEIYPYGSSASMFSFNCSTVEELNFPELKKITINESLLPTVFRTESNCKRAIFKQIPIETIRKYNSYGLPVGCLIIGKDSGSYIVQ